MYVHSNTPTDKGQTELCRLLTKHSNAPHWMTKSLHSAIDCRLQRIRNLCRGACAGRHAEEVRIPEVCLERVERTSNGRSRLHPSRYQIGTTDT